MLTKIPSFRKGILLCKSNIKSRNVLDRGRKIGWGPSLIHRSPQQRHQVFTEHKVVFHISYSFQVLYLPKLDLVHNLSNRGLNVFVPYKLCMRNIPLPNNIFTSFHLTFHLEKQVLLPFSPPKSSLIPSPLPQSHARALSSEKQPRFKKMHQMHIRGNPRNRKENGIREEHKGDSNCAFLEQGGISEGLTFASFGKHMFAVLFSGLSCSVLKFSKLTRQNKTKKLLFISTI